jgi:hypothetical protein
VGRSDEARCSRRSHPEDAVMVMVMREEKKLVKFGSCEVAEVGVCTRDTGAHYRYCTVLVLQYYSTSASDS